MMRDAGSKLVAFVRSLLLLGTFVVAVPWVLVAVALSRFGGSTPWHAVPPPGRWEIDRIRGAVTDRLTDQTIADIVIRLSLVVGWVAVIVVLLTVVAEFTHMIRYDGLAMPQIRGLGMSQPVARVIASGLLVVVPLVASPSRVVAREGTDAGTRARASISSVSDALERAPFDRPDNVWPSTPTPDSGGGAPTRVGGTANPSGAASGQAPSAAPAVAPGHYVVRPGDSIYGIAERLAGPDAGAVSAYAGRMIELNMGRTMPDGQRLTNAAFIDVGWVLQLPVDQAADAVADASDVHVVERGESLWSIADDELGDAARWPEIFDANQGRTFSDGGELRDPDLIRPGWGLRVPDGSAASAATPVVDSSTMVDPAQVADAIEEPAVETDPVSEVAAASDRSGGVIDGVAGADDLPDVAARPRNVWLTPTGDPVGAAVPTLAPSDPVGAAVPTDPVERSAGEAATDDRIDETRDGAVRFLTLGSAAMLSAGVLTLLAVRRRMRLRGARARARIPEPPERSATVERALRSIDAGDLFARVDVAIRAAAIPLIEHGERVVAVHVGADGEIELVASGSVVLPSPWHGSAERWILPASIPLELLADDARRVGAPTPALVQLGRDLDGRDVYVDLEALEAIEIGGPGDRADAVVAAIAATLAGSVLAEVTTLIGLGVPDHTFLGHRLHVPVEDAQRAFEAAADAIGSTASQSRSTFELRARVTSGETWEPAVVLAGSAAGTIVPPRSRTGLAVVSASPIHGPSSRLAPDGDAWVLQPAAIRLVPIGLSPDDVEALAELVDVAEPRPIAAGDHDPDAAAPEVDDDRTLVPPRDDDAVEPGGHSDETSTGQIDGDDGRAAPIEALPWTLLVRLLGPVDVVDASGTSVSFERSKTMELVAWLATHRERSTRIAARTALWELDVARRHVRQRGVRGSPIVGAARGTARGPGVGRADDDGVAATARLGPYRCRAPRARPGCSPSPAARSGDRDPHTRGRAHRRSTVRGDGVPLARRRGDHLEPGPARDVGCDRTRRTLSVRRRHRRCVQCDRSRPPGAARPRGVDRSPHAGTRTCGRPCRCPAGMGELRAGDHGRSLERWGALAEAGRPAPGAAAPVTLMRLPDRARADGQGDGTRVSIGPGPTGGVTGRGCRSGPGRRAG